MSLRLGRANYARNNPKEIMHRNINKEDIGKEWKGGKSKSAEREGDEKPGYQQRTSGESEVKERYSTKKQAQVRKVCEQKKGEEP